MNPRHAWSHYIGLTASLLCLVHCLALPLVTPFLPLLAGHNHWFTESLFVTLIALSTLTIYRGYKTHRDKRSLCLAIPAFGLLSFSLLIPHTGLQIAVSVLGSFLMTLAHYTNYQFCRHHKPCCDHAH